MPIDSTIAHGIARPRQAVSALAANSAMSRAALLVLILGTTQSCAGAPEPSWSESASQFMEARLLEAPLDQHGLVERTYSLRDLDSDGIPEILESIPDWETEREFLNIELGSAFEWISVYHFDSGTYLEATALFENFLANRRAHYELLARIVQSPEVLSADSQAATRSSLGCSPTSSERWDSPSALSWGSGPSSGQS